MKQVIMAIAMILIGLAWMQPANAAFLVEPYAGWAVSGQVDYDITDPSTLDDQGDATGPGFGARLGYLMENFSAGIDYSILNVEPDFGTAEDTNLDTKNLGVYIAYTFPIELRLWGAFLLDTRANFGADELTGTGFKVGAGYKVLPWMALNLEFYQQDWDKINGVSLGEAAPYRAFDSEMYLISASFPFQW